MRITKQYFSIVLLLFIFCFKGFSANQKDILVLNSYHNGLSWTDSIVSSIKREFSTKLSYSIYIEDMDTKRYFSQNYLNLLAKFYQEKYKNKKFDLIISTDNNAYDFLLEYKNQIFGSVPVLFCGLNSTIDVPKGYSGVFENMNFCSTIHLIKENHPKFSELVIVSDKTTTGKVMAQFVEDDIKNMEELIPYRIIQPDNMPNLQKELSSLDKNSIVLYLLYNRDSEGKYYTYEDSFREVIPYCKVPIYCVWDFYMGHGAVGGTLITGRNQGKQVAEMAKRVLSGTSIDDIPSQKAKYENCFDYKQLTRFNIDRSKLPKDSRIINEPYSFVRENKEIVILTLTVLILLTIIIIVMTINMHLRKVRAQKEKAHLLEIKANHEELKIAKEAAEESSRLKSAFLANMSHEIRTPMNAILGFTDLLAGDYVEKEKRTRFISIIQRNTKHLLRLISDILDISKIETNQLKIVKNKCVLDNLFVNLNEIYEAILDLHDNKNLSIITTVPDDKSISEFNTDTMRLVQIFNNLIENSIKFTNIGTIEIGYDIKGDFLRFFVKDTGIGISEDKQKIIFDRFRQADLNADTRTYGGTGLGLAISKSLVELLGGEIWFTSKLNEGTTFYFTIPF
ncbi:sensor histidine kinase [Labilibaculum euxinus]|uniref:sensor histidine kinase n=1 Tax=Labilibaculum euxinus TaxID=2686357 RepID=UPI001365B228|nr:HAMP domain-containing sensor histidine kinase [Labilibaculum euxinus]MDQ1770969.1 HAMP domain-containing sensor histidine kinase [Labilibaculum euxinus]